MPGVMILIEEAERRHDADEAAPQAEDALLWLPSQVPEDQQPFVCDASLLPGNTYSNTKTPM